MQVYVVAERDYPPVAVFDTLDAAKAYVREHDLLEADIIGPLEVNEPDADLTPWWEQR